MLWFHQRYRTIDQLKLTKAQIVIVGAGPSGLLLAILLAQAHIPSIVLEAYPWLDTRLRATQYGTPATRIFRRAGLLPDFRAASIPKFSGICWRRVADGEKLISIDLGVTQNEEDRMTVLPLGEIIQIMYRHCIEKYADYIDIRFNHKVLSTGQDEEKKKAWVDLEIGKEDEERHKERMEADYIIGCDGASSAVRHSLFGRDWPGKTWDCRFIVQNVFYDGFEKHGWDGGNYMVDPEHWGLVARRGKDGKLWRVTYGDPEPGLTDEEYLERRPWHFKAILPGHPEPNEYRIESTNMYNIHNRCAPTFKVGRILLAADAAHVNNPMGGYGCMSACLDVGGLADCLIGLHDGRAGEDILDTYAQVRRDIFVKYIDRRSTINLERVWKTDPWTVKDTDKFFQVLKEVNRDEQTLKDFLLKYSSIEHDFTQYYNKTVESKGKACNGSMEEGKLAADAQLSL